jgi:putative tryptophan/tyrosine transport system substrate-binding protein
MWRLTRRRDFIASFGAAAVWPIDGYAQEKVNPIIGILEFGRRGGRLTTFKSVLQEAGYVEGRNVAIEYRGEATNANRQREFAADLVRRPVAVILAFNDGPALAATHATSTIPIVFVDIGSDPVKLGLVANINKPGGNVTGVGFSVSQVATKRLDLLCQLIPTTTRVAYLTGGPSFFSSAEEKDELLAAAEGLGRPLIIVECRTANEVGQAFATLIERGAGALIVAYMPIFFGAMKTIVALAAQYKIPTVYPGRGFVLEGGLFSYTSDAGDSLRIAAGLVGQILNGAKAGELAVRRSTKFNMVINMQTASALGIKIPARMLIAAAEVIE